MASPQVSSGESDQGRKSKRQIIAETPVKADDRETAGNQVTATTPSRHSMAQQQQKHIELSPFNVPLHWKSPLQTTNYDVLLPESEEKIEVYKTHVEDGFTLKSRKSEKFQPLTPVKKSKSKVRHKYCRKNFSPEQDKRG